MVYWVGGYSQYGRYGTLGGHGQYIWHTGCTWSLEMAYLVNMVSTDGKQRQQTVDMVRRNGIQGGHDDQ